MSQTKVQHDKPRNELHVVFREDRLIASREWFAPTTYLELAADGEVLSITFCEYYTKPEWALTEDHVRRFHLEGRLEDLRLVYEAFFRKRVGNVSVRRIEDDRGVVYDRDNPEL